MTDNSKSREGRDPADLEEIERASKQGVEGQTAHGGDVTGPASDESGRPLAPQTGEPIDHSH